MICVNLVTYARFPESSENPEINGATLENIRRRMTLKLVDLQQVTLIEKGEQSICSDGFVLWVRGKFSLPLTLPFSTSTR